MVLNYIKLQLRLLKRRFVEAGFSALLFYPVILGLHVLLYHFVKAYPTWGAYSVSLINLQVLFTLSDFRRIDFLKTTFTKRDYYNIRLIENSIISSGSIIVLLISGHFVLAAVSIILCVGFLFTTTAFVWTRRIPTPFTKKPFEFIIGFRRTWLLLLILYSIAMLGAIFGNQNLALFGLFCICFCCMFYYDQPEPSMVLWNRSRTASQFLMYKIRRGLVQLSLLILPLMGGIVAFFPESYYKVLIVWFLGLFLIPFVICVKYAVFPRKINITEGSILALCLAFYPLVLALIPYYFYKAVSNLNKLP